MARQCRERVTFLIGVMGFLMISGCTPIQPKYDAARMEYLSRCAIEKICWSYDTASSNTEDHSAEKGNASNTH
jgi:hypothetical protein